MPYFTFRGFCEIVCENTFQLRYTRIITLTRESNGIRVYARTHIQD